jgi:hypothetical protein
LVARLVGVPDAVNMEEIGSREEVSKVERWRRRWRREKAAE